MSQPPQEPPTTPNSGENTAPGPTSVQGTPTTEGGDGNVGSNEDMQVRRGRLPPLQKQCVLSFSVVDTHALLMQARIGEAEGLKQEGNDLFRRGKWDEALQTYRNGLAQLPKRRNPPPPPPSPPPATDEEGERPPAEGDANRIPTDAQNQHESTVPSDADSPLERECTKARSVLNANIAACHVKLASTHARSFRTEPRLTGCLVQGENEDAVKACTEGSLWATVDMNAPSERTLSFAG